MYHWSIPLNIIHTSRNIPGLSISKQKELVWILGYMIGFHIPGLVLSNFRLLFLYIFGPQYHFSFSEIQGISNIHLKLPSFQWYYFCKFWSPLHILFIDCVLILFFQWVEIIIFRKIQGRSRSDQYHWRLCWARQATYFDHVEPIFALHLQLFFMHKVLFTSIAMLSKLARV